MFEIEQTSQFAVWLRKLRDRAARGRIVSRLERLRLGNFGDTKSVGDGLRELRIDVGPGYRVYFVQRGTRLILLLHGGDKDSQPRDIARAREIAAELEI